MNKIDIGFAVWEKLDDGKCIISYYDDNVKVLNSEEQVQIISAIIENTLINDNFISSAEIVRTLKIPGNENTERERVKKFLGRLREDEKWKGAIEVRRGYRIRDAKKGASQSIDKSLFLSECPADGTKCYVGENFTKSWTIRNNGNQIWRNRYMRCDPLPFHVSVEPQTVPMPTIHPGEEFTLIVTYKADDEGMFYSVWKTYDESGNQVFPNAGGLYVTLVVVRPHN